MKPNFMRILQSPQDIDLSTPGVIEAHAGTGKTFTIVQMVLRILQQPQDNRFIHIREVLLVTYTDKAAGELQAKIREGLEKSIAQLGNNNAPVRDHLSDCLNNLHEAFIGTIHSVCQRLLRTWPFETRSPFTTEIVNDAEGLEQTLRDSIRTDWQQEASQIPWALAKLGSQNTTISEKTFTEITQLTDKILDSKHSILDRQSIGGHSLPSLHRAMEQYQEVSTSATLIREFQHLLSALQNEVQKIDAPSASEPEASEAFAQLPQRLQRMWDQPLLAWQEDWVNLFKFRKISTNKFNNLFSKGVNQILQSFTKPIMETAFLNAGLQLQQLETIILPTLQCDAAEILRDRWNSKKDKECLLSFQDMLSRMSLASESLDFRHALRERLRYGIIDEFQDTSVLQWSIFRNLFFENDRIVAHSTLYLVGDPKQSIYAFQGADVSTYMEARSYVLDRSGKLYGLVQNYRSTPDLIEGYNAILGNCDWFHMPGIDYPMQGDGGQMASAPPRAHKSTAPWKRGAVQVMNLQGSARQCKQEMAKQCAHAIQALLGTEVQVPDGPGWRSLILDPSHFAVIVEAHNLAEPFLDEFRRWGIPATKYKLQGVFKSPMARDLSTLLRAIGSEPSQADLRIPALLTRFYNLHPSEVEPERDLDQNSTLSRNITEWISIRDRRRWGQLFASIQRSTHIAERLALLQDGERHLADWRQLVEYSLEYLVRENHSLPELAEHLHRLLNEEERARDEQNLHLLSTGKASVKVLTMHASKGLEFPVVFVIPSGSKKRSHKVKFWMGEDHNSRVMLADSDTMKSLFGESNLPTEIQADQERRRLLYVALTRPQFLLFVPIQVSDKGNVAESLLTPRLQKLRSQGSLEEFDPSAWPIPYRETLYQDSALPDLPPEYALADAESQKVLQRIEALHLPWKHAHQTSYTELSHGIQRDHQVSPSEEIEAPAPNMPSALPGGKETGDALHLVLEECLALDDMDWKQIKISVEKHLEANKVLARLDTQEAKAKAIEVALRMVQLSMESHLDLQNLNAPAIRLSDLPVSCRKAELEFQLKAGPDWVHGFMDLVFRIPAPEAAHPWRYFILDWKSNGLEKYDAEHIEQSIKSSHYDLQAKLYIHALDVHLKGLLGHSYNAAQNLGGAVYVYLRAFEYADTCIPWLLKPDVQECAEFVQEKLQFAFPRNSQGVPT